MFNPHSIPYQSALILSKSFYRDNRLSLLKNIKLHCGNSLKKNSFILMKSQHEYHFNYDDDCTADILPEVNFSFLFGNNYYQNMYGLIDIDTGRATLSVEDSTIFERIICKLLTKDLDPTELNVDEIIYNSELENYMNTLDGEIFIFQGIMSGIYILVFFNKY